MQVKWYLSHMSNESLEKKIKKQCRYTPGASKTSKDQGFLNEIIWDYKGCQANPYTSNTTCWRVLVALLLLDRPAADAPTLFGMGGCPLINSYQILQQLYLQKHCIIHFLCLIVCGISAFMIEIGTCSWRFILGSFTSSPAFLGSRPQHWEGPWLIPTLITSQGGIKLWRLGCFLKYEADGFFGCFLDPINWEGLGNLGAEAWFWKCCTLQMAYLETSIGPPTLIQLWHCCPWNGPTCFPSRHLLWIESCWHPGSSGHQGRHPPGAPSCHNLKALKPFQDMTEMWARLERCDAVQASPYKDLCFLFETCSSGNAYPVRRWETRFLQIPTHLRASLYL